MSLKSLSRMATLGRLFDLFYLSTGRSAHPTGGTRTLGVKAFDETRRRLSLSPDAFIELQELGIADEAQVFQ